MRTGEGSGSGAAAPRLHRPQAEPGAGRPPQRSSPDLPRLLGTESRLAETRFIQLKVTKQGKLSSPFPLFFFVFFPWGRIYPSLLTPRPQVHPPLSSRAMLWQPPQSSWAMGSTGCPQGHGMAGAAAVERGGRCSPGQEMKAGTASRGTAASPCCPSRIWRCLPGIEPQLLQPVSNPSGTRLREREDAGQRQSADAQQGILHCREVLSLQLHCVLYLHKSLAKASPLPSEPQPCISVAQRRLPEPRSLL